MTRGGQQQTLNPVNLVAPQKNVREHNGSITLAVGNPPRPKVRPLALKALRGTLPHFAFPEKGGAAFSSAIKFLMKNSMYLFRLSTVASRSYAIEYPRTFLIGRG
jgi:hypothetical protein